MKLRFKIFPLLVFVLIGCENNDDDNNVDELLIKNYKTKYMDYPIDYDENSSSEIIYENGKVVKRINTFSKISALGSSSIYNFYDEVSYQGNEINIIFKTNDNQTVGESSIKIKLANNLIAEKKYFYDNYIVTNNYSYSKDKLIKVNSSQNGLTPNYLSYQKNIYYNSKNNVDSIVTRQAEFNPISNSYVLDLNSKKRTVEVFSDFDNTINNTKKLNVFEELFNRSLSQNNYRKYEKIGFDVDGIRTSYLKKDWSFVYLNNNIDFSK